VGGGASLSLQTHSSITILVLLNQKKKGACKGLCKSSDVLSPSQLAGGTGWKIGDDEKKVAEKKTGCGASSSLFHSSSQQLLMTIKLIDIIDWILIIISFLIL
jgi:hypothetical protein